MIVSNHRPPTCGGRLGGNADGVGVLIGVLPKGGRTPNDLPTPPMLVSTVGRCAFYPTVVRWLSVLQQVRVTVESRNLPFVDDAKFLSKFTPQLLDIRHGVDTVLRVRPRNYIRREPRRKFRAADIIDGSNANARHRRWQHGSSALFARNSFTCNFEWIKNRGSMLSF